VCRRNNAGFIDLSILGVNESNYTQWLLNDSGGSIFVHYNEALKQKVADQIVQSFPWYDYKPVSLLNDNFESITFDINHTMEKSEIDADYNLYTPYQSGLIPQDGYKVTNTSRSTVSNESFYIGDGVCLNFYCTNATNGIKVYATENPTEYALILCDYGPVTAKIPAYHGMSTITVELVDGNTSTVRIFSPVVGKDVFARRYKQNLFYITADYLSSNFTLDNARSQCIISDDTCSLQLAVKNTPQVNAGATWVVATIPLAVRPQFTVPIYGYVQNGSTLYPIMGFFDTAGHVAIHSENAIPADSSFRLSCAY
jgi:hypothetical protein